MIGQFIVVGWLFIQECDSSIPFNKKGYTEYTLLHIGAEDGREFTLSLSPFLGSIKSYDKYVDVENMSILWTRLISVYGFIKTL